MTVQRVLRSTAATVSWQPLDSDGAPAAPAGTVTVGVTAADGTEVLPAGTATTGAGAAPRTAALTAAHTAALDRLTVTWTDSGAGAQTTTVEIVGGYYLSLAEMRADESLTVQKVENADLFAARSAVEDEWERVAGVAFVPRFERETLHCAGPSATTRWPMLRSVRSVSTRQHDDTYLAMSESELAQLEFFDFGGITGLPWAQTVVVEYEHGYDGLPSAGKAHALRHVRAKVFSPMSGIPDRAERYTSPDGAWAALATADADHTGYPEIDGFLARYSMRTVGA